MLPEDQRPVRGPGSQGGPLVWLMMPFVAGFLSVRWMARAMVHGLGRAMEALADAAVAVGRGLATGVRAVGHVIAELGRRGAAILRAVGHALADVLRAVGHVLAELGRRLVVVLKAIAHQVARPIRAFGHILAEIGRRVAALLRTAGHASAQLLRAVGHVIAEGFLLAGRGMVRLLVALRPVASLSGRTVGRLVARALVVLLIGVLAVCVPLYVAGVSARALVFAAVHAIGTVTRAITAVLGPPLRLVARGLGAAFRMAAEAARQIASGAVVAISGAVRLIAAATRLVADRLVAPAVRAARTALLVFVVAFVVTGRATGGSWARPLRPSGRRSQRRQGCWPPRSPVRRGRSAGRCRTRGSGSAWRWPVPPTASGLRSGALATACNGCWAAARPTRDPATVGSGRDPSGIARDMEGW